MNQTSKKIISVFLVISILFCSLPFAGFVGLDLSSLFRFKVKAIDSGICGNNLTWTLDDNGVLTIEGTGAMYDFNSSGYVYVWGSGGEEYPTYNYTTIERTERPTIKPTYNNDYYTTVAKPTSPDRPDYPTITSPDRPDYPTTTNPYDYYYNSASAVTPVEEEVCSVRNEESTTAPSIYRDSSNNESISIKYNAEIGDAPTIDETTTKSSPTEPSYIIVYRWNTYRDEIKKVVIGDGITSIGDYAFADCTQLEEIEMPNSIKSIGYNAFCDCVELTEIEIPQNVSTIENYAFDNCLALKTINFNAKNCNDIYYNAFYNTSVKTLNVGVGVNNIPRLYELETVTFVDGATVVPDNAFSGCTKLKTVNLPDSITKIEDEAFYGCNSLSSLVIPDTVQSIGSNAFANSGLIKIIIPDSVTSIGEWAFGDCYSLEFLKLGNGITKIEPYTFVQCYSLKSVILGENVTLIGESAFQGCGINFLILHKKISKIEEGAFRDCSFLSDVFYKGVRSDWNNIVILDDNDDLIRSNICCEDDKNSDLNSGLSWSFDSDTGTLYINGEGEIGWNGGELPPWNNHRPDVLKVVIGNGITSLGSALFSDFMFLEEVVLPEGITAIGDWTFDSCMFLSKIELPDTIKSIGDFAFWGCSSLQEISIPGSVETIGLYAFSNCENLNEIILENGILKIGGSAFERCSSLESITIPESVTEIGYDAFYYCTNLREVEFNAINCTYAGASDDVYSAFYGCDKLTDVTIGDKVESIPACFLSQCRKVERIVIPDSVKTIGHHAFWYCDSLIDITIGDNIEEIGGWAFDYTGYANNEENRRDNLICLDYCLIGVTGYDIVVDESITVIQDHVFRSNWNLYSVELPSWMTEIDDYMFDGCYNLRSINIPDGVKEIGSYAFYGCGNLSQINIPNTVETIGDFVFAYCNNITHLRIPSSVKHIGDTAFYGCDNNAMNLLCEEGSYGCYYAESHRMNLSIFMKEVGGYCIIKNGVLTSFYGEGFDDYEYHCNLVIPSNVKSIGYYAFENNNRIVNIELPYSVTTIYSRAFANCPNLESVIIPFTVTDIADSAFEGTDATIYCYYNSYAYNYAVANGIDYELITVTLSTNSVNMNSGDSITVNAVPSVTVASGIPMVWKSSNSDVVSVDSTGNIVANGVGSATVGIYSFDGALFDKCSVTVSEPVDEFENVELKFEDVSTDKLNYGEKILFHINVADLPEGASVKWTTSNGAVLKISNENAACGTHEGCVTCTVESVGSGSAEIIGVVVDENGEPILRDGEEIKVSYIMNSKAGFFQKLIAFFKKLFGLSKIILQSIE